MYLIIHCTQLQLDLSGMCYQFVGVIIKLLYFTYQELSFIFIADERVLLFSYDVVAEVENREKK